AESSVHFILAPLRQLPYWRNGTTEIAPRGLDPGHSCFRDGGVPRPEPAFWREHRSLPFRDFPFLPVLPVFDFPLLSCSSHFRRVRVFDATSMPSRVFDRTSSCIFLYFVCKKFFRAATGGRRWAIGLRGNRSRGSGLHQIGFVLRESENG